VAEPAKKWRDLCSVLTDEFGVARGEVDRAFEIQRQTGQKVGRILVNLGVISEAVLRDALSRLLGLPVWERRKDDIYPPLDLFPLEFLRSNRLLPLELDEERLRVALADPQDGYLVEAIAQAAGRRVEMLVGCEKDIMEALEETYQGAGGEAEPDEWQAGGVEVSEDIEHLKDLASEAPVIRLVGRLLNRAIELGASDIHIERFERDCRARLRVDGVLTDVEAPTRDLYAAVVSRIKILSKLDIAERRLPQDGRINLKVAGRNVDVRVSIIPSMYGENVVLRILDRSALTLDLESIGVTGGNLETLRELIRRPYGMMLVTGPTGSGKTTTLYAALREIISPSLKIITIEDPVEYNLEGVQQIQVRPQIGLTFASGLRSILRHDPDVIMVGEIRDGETAKIAVQSALTGHLVLSTLHTNTAAAAFGRLVDMGVEDYLVSSSVLAVMAQRLVRCVCSQCREEYTLTTDVRGLVELGAGTRLYRGRGCPACERTGYRGRTSICELLPLNDELRDMITSRRDAGTIARASHEAGVVSIWSDGIAKVLNGVTTIEELSRVAE